MFKLADRNYDGYEYSMSITGTPTLEASGSKEVKISVVSLEPEVLQ
ncbi:MAG: hypothetical protein IJR85_04355 [Synergistaceae bacterium]|nr:hypothetical protein [Synergistaceae bacterium]